MSEDAFADESGDSAQQDSGRDHGRQIRAETRTVGRGAFFRDWRGASYQVRLHVETSVCCISICGALCAVKGDARRVPACARTVRTNRSEYTGPLDAAVAR